MNEQKEATPIDELEFSSGKENTLKTLFRMMARQVFVPPELQPTMEEVYVQIDIADSHIDR